jgi:hypothetical protein
MVGARRCWNPDRWQRSSNCFTTLQLTPNERSTFLNARCGADAELRREVEALLAIGNDGQTSSRRRRQTWRASSSVAPIRRLARNSTLPDRVAHRRGGMGSVCRAYDPRLRRTVAVKLLRMSSEVTRPSSSPNGKRGPRGVGSSNILAVHDVGVQDGQPYIVSELLEGVSVRSLIEHGRGPDVDAMRDRRVPRSRWRTIAVS